MRVRPWPIIIIALIHIFAPLFNIYFSAKLNQATFFDYLEYLLRNKNIAENLFWIVLPFVTGLSILKFKKWSYLLVIGFTLATSFLFLQEWITTPQLPLRTFALLQTMNLAMICYFLLPSVRNVYLKPSLRWWEQKPRYLVDVAIDIQGKNSFGPGKIKNISEGGAMIETSLDFSRGDIFKITFEMFQKKFTAEAQVIFKGFDGFGTFFTEVTPSQNELNKLMDQLAVQGFPLRTERPNLKENFKYWMKGAVRGKGLTPQIETRGDAIVRSTPKTKKEA
jgi:hypothetical protein